MESHYPGLILTVGMTHEPVVYSIRHAGADHVAFVCTPDSEKGTLDKVIGETQLAPSAWRKYVVPDDPAEIGRLCIEFHSAYRWLTEECGLRPEKIAADPTAGRKWMSTGATMIAAFLGLTMHYVDVRYVDRKPDPASMRVVELGNAYDQTGFVEAEKGRSLYNRWEFATSADIFERIRPSYSPQADLYQGLAELARALDAWERFEHYQRTLTPEFNSALERLRRHTSSLAVPNPCLSSFVDHVASLAHAIEELHLGTRPAAGFTVDIFENACRRMQQGRVDDACGRLYRTLESLSQLLLHQQYDIETAKPQYAQLTDEQRAAVSAACGGLPEKVDLVTGFKMLKALNHPVGGLVIVGEGKKQSIKFSGLLEARDHSILAHGFQSIDTARVTEFVTRLEGLLKDALPKEFEQWSNRLKVPELPRLLA